MVPKSGFDREMPQRSDGVRRSGGVVSLVVAAAVGLTVCAPGAVLPSYAGTGPSPAVARSPKIVPIDFALAGGSTDAAREAIAIWNREVPSLRFVEMSAPATLRVVEIETPEGSQSRVDPDGLGRGVAYVDVPDAALYGATRVLVHELGHLLSLDDLRGVTDCSKVMALPVPDCTNVTPHADESAAVAEFFECHELGDTMPGWELPGEEPVSRTCPGIVSGLSGGDLAEQVRGRGVGVVAVEELRERSVELGAVQTA